MPGERVRRPSSTGERTWADLLVPVPEFCGLEPVFPLLEPGMGDGSWNAARTCRGAVFADPQGATELTRPLQAGIVDWLILAWASIFFFAATRAASQAPLRG